MAKLKKQFKGTAGKTPEGVAGKNTKGNLKNVSPKGGVKKPQQNADKKRAPKLPDNFKEKLKQKGPANDDIKSKLFANKGNKINKGKKLPVEQAETKKNGQKLNSAQILQKKTEQKSAKGAQTLQKKNEHESPKGAQTFQKKNEQKSVKGAQILEKKNKHKSANADIHKKKSAGVKQPNESPQKVVKDKKKLNPQKSLPKPAKIDKLADISVSPEKQKPLKKSKKNFDKKIIGQPGKSVKKPNQNKLQKVDKKVLEKKTEKKSKAKDFPASIVSLKDILPPFEEEKFDEALEKDKITELLKGLKKIVQEEVGKKKNQVFSDYRYMLNVTCFKVPLCPKRIVKLKVKHSLVADDEDICLIVKDLQRGSKFDTEPTAQHYEDLLKEKGVSNIKAIIPMSQLRKEYGSYEMKKKLSNLYDFYLCDGTIVGHVVGFLGNVFRKTKCTLHAVRFNTPNIANEIEKSLHKTSYKQGEKGTTVTIPVGTHKMSPKQVADNILTVISQLKTTYPGGLPNIRHLYAKINIKGTSAIPLYFSGSCPPEEVPVVIGPREQKIKKLRTDVNQILNKFQLTASGDFEGVKKDGSPQKRKRDEEGGDKEPSIKKKKPSKEGKTKNQKDEENKSTKEYKNLVDVAKSKNAIREKRSKLDDIGDDEYDDAQDEISEEGKPERAPQPEDYESDSSDTTFTDSAVFDTSLSSGSGESSSEFSENDGGDDSDDEEDSEPKENGIEGSDEDNESESSEDDSDGDDDDDED